MKKRLIYIRPSWRKIIADLWGNKTRSALVIASIAVGVFAVGMIGGAYFIIPGNMNSSYSSANPANIEILTAPFDEGLLDAIRRLEGVQEVTASRMVNVSVITGSKQWHSFDLEALSDYSPGRINSQLHLQGADIPGKQQVLLEKRAAEKYAVGPGDVLQIELADGTSRQLSVVGVVQDLTSGIGGMVDNPKGYIVDDTLEWLHVPVFYNKLLVTVTSPNDKAFIQQTADKVGDKLEKGGRQVYKTEQHEKNRHPMDSILQALLRILLVLGVLIVFLSGSLISNTLTALLNQHLPQIGILKLVGARSRQIVILYLVLIFSYSVIALALALPLGSIAAFGLSAFAADLIGFPLQGFQVIPLALLIQVAIALVVPVIASLPPILSGAHITVVNAITGTGRIKGPVKKSVLTRWLGGIEGISRPFLMAVRNTFRHKLRLALTLLTLTLGGAIFISVFNVQVSLNNKIERITKYFGADVNLDFSRSYSVAEIGRQTDGITGISRVEAWAITQGEILDVDSKVENNFTLIAPPAASEMVAPILMQGRWITHEDRGVVAINEAFLKKYPALKVGDTLYLKVDGRKADWKVVGIFQFTGDEELVAYTNYEHLSVVINEPSQTAFYRIASDDHSLSSQDGLSNKLDTHFRGKGFRVSKTESGGAFSRSLTEYIAILTGFLVMMALLTAVVGSIGMAGTLSMNIMERTREIGIMRAIGARNGSILKLVLVEGLLIGMISYLFGSVLSFPISTVLAELISQAIFSAHADFSFTVWGFAVWLGVVLLLSTVSSLLPAKNATRLTIREVLAYE